MCVPYTTRPLHVLLTLLTNNCLDRTSMLPESKAELMDTPSLLRWVLLGEALVSHLRGSSK